MNLKQSMDVIKIMIKIMIMIMRQYVTGFTGR